MVRSPRKTPERYRFPGSELRLGVRSRHTTPERRPVRRRSLLRMISFGHVAELRMRFQAAGRNPGSGPAHRRQPGGHGDEQQERWSPIVRLRASCARQLRPLLRRPRIVADFGVIPSRTFDGDEFHPFVCGTGRKIDFARSPGYLGGGGEFSRLGTPAGAATTAVGHDHARRRARRGRRIRGFRAIAVVDAVGSLRGAAGSRSTISAGSGPSA